VCDLASAHALALNYLREGGDTVAINLGTGKGFSVKEIIATVESVTGKTIPVVYGERRAGDPSELVADPSLAAKVIGWKAVHLDPREHIESAWKWMTGPRGGRYAD
jgi:UDP-glucose 4-epimerase